MKNVSKSCFSLQRCSLFHSVKPSVVHRGTQRVRDVARNVIWKETDVDSGRLELSAARTKSGGIEVENALANSAEVGVFEVRGTFEATCSADTVFSVLRDYSSAPQVFSTILTSSVQRDGDSNEYSVTQSCCWQFLVFSGEFDVHLTVKEDREARVLQFSQAQSAFTKEFVGSWRVTPTAPDTCLVEHRLRLRPAAVPPPAVSGYAVQILSSQVRGILGDLKTFVSDQGDLGPGGSDGPGALDDKGWF